MFNYTFYENLLEEIEIPRVGITSRPLYQGDKVRAVIFGFAENEEMTEHTASSPAIVQVLEGECIFTFDQEPRTMTPGSWAIMDAKMPHSIQATKPLKFLLHLLKDNQ
ncbi:TPA: cupin domain-containing protein [Photobacterium damselae]|uniref:cupin domain-containing protein n=1 Tax=Photobacterium damselae TaxID=38293 RepID=UPI000D661180|nr:cupin domain-containing protein [Photobacterium damselae]AWK83951.1 cupin [Photobacterium damselae]MBA5683519.1 cupin domain-containing protein [Photobacterium damselae subsp. damselae]NVH52726.1 cupin domain-containing protein [Photobacterium damselae subsp. damselae]NVO80156.1 cupin domain-containing protein [Photobacterium damselae subsp. damselae]TLS80281.1 cupin domain-containing protein [Photobacterium damselae subsp. damselae]